MRKWGMRGWGGGGERVGGREPKSCGTGWPAGVCVCVGGEGGGGEG